MSKKQSPNPSPRRGRGSMRWWIPLAAAALIVLSLVTLFLLKGDSPAQLTYSEFMHALEDGRVAEVTITDGRALKGRFMIDAVGADADAAGDGGVDAGLGDSGGDGTNPTEGMRFETLLPVQDSEVLIAQLRGQGVAIRAERGGGSPAAPLILPLVLILVVGFLIWRLRPGDNLRMSTYGKSRAKSLDPSRPRVTFADVAGAEEAKADLGEVVNFLKDPHRFGRLGGRLPKGVLLVGSPGTGKTLLARAVAGEADRPFFSISGSDFVEMYVGVGASRVRDLFARAKPEAPCIIFIDEIDAVGRQRGSGMGGGNDEREQTLNQLLVEMDGFEENSGIILIAATNRPDILDPALLRPGRFDRRIMVDAPDVRGRESILQVHARRLPLADDVELATVARGTPGMSGADLANVCNEAALLAVGRGADQVVMDDFERARDRILMGVERRSVVLSEEERRLTAYHEAGHVVVGLKVPGSDPVHKVTIIPRGRAMGVTAYLPEGDRHSYRKDFLTGQLAVLFGGRMAEEIVLGADRITTGAGNDIERATDIARKMITRYGMSDAVGPVCIAEEEGAAPGSRSPVSERTAELVDSEIRRVIDEARARAKDLLVKERPLLERIAEALLVHETLARDEILALVEDSAGVNRPASVDSGEAATEGAAA
jgi:cell division protease FtsH